ncbi:hypothetical protein [Armatimonas sp.]|uniref:hypothetical protein n=1 Tax=Armatimonas sp. TaxID=1872638 RepID=UPI003750A3FC
MSSDESTMSATEATLGNDEAAMSSSESAKTKKKRPTPAEQDVELANFISQSRVTIETILATPEILSLLPRRYDAEKLTAGLAIQSTAQGSYTARQTAIGDETAANLAVTEGRKVAYDRYVHFRETARAEFRGQAERQALGVVGTIPVDTEKLLTQAKASYTAAGQGSYATALEDLGYDAAGRSAALATVTTLQSARATQEMRRTAAIAATATRNADAKTLREWMQALHRVTKASLRNHPELLGRL